MAMGFGAGYYGRGYYGTSPQRKVLGVNSRNVGYSGSSLLRIVPVPNFQGVAVGAGRQSLLSTTTMAMLSNNALNTVAWLSLRLVMPGIRGVAVCESRIRLRRVTGASVDFRTIAVTDARFNLASLLRMGSLSASAVSIEKLTLTYQWASDDTPMTAWQPTEVNGQIWQPTEVNGQIWQPTEVNGQIWRETPNRSDSWGNA